MKTLSLLCCSVLRREVETFLAQDYPEAELVFLDSTLHMHPEQLRQQLDAALAARPDRHCLLVYGDCHARMRETCERPNCWRIEAVNCADLLLGHSQENGKSRSSGVEGKVLTDLRGDLQPLGGFYLVNTNGADFVGHGEDGCLSRRLGEFIEKRTDHRKGREGRARPISHGENFKTECVGFCAENFAQPPGVFKG